MSTTNELYQALKAAPIQQATEAANLFLHSVTASNTSGYQRIVNESTGQAFRVFTTKSGRRYTIWNETDGLNILRLTGFNKMSSVVGTDLNIAQQQQQINNLVDLINSFSKDRSPIFELATAVQNMQQTLHSVARDWPASLMAATYFIIEDDEDVTKYDPGKAESKIADWNDSNIYPPDFFFLSLDLAAKLNEQQAQLLLRFMA